MNRLLLAAVLVVGLCPIASAAEPGADAAKPVGTGPLARAWRGVVNIIISPIEVPATVRRVAEERHPAFALWAGTLEGFGNGFVRLGAGVVELGTAPLPFHYLPLYPRRLGERSMHPARPPMSVTRP